MTPNEEKKLNDGLQRVRNQTRGRLMINWFKLGEFKEKIRHLPADCNSFVVSDVLGILTELEMPDDIQIVEIVNYDTFVDNKKSFDYEETFDVEACKVRIKEFLASLNMDKVCVVSSSYISTTEFSPEKYYMESDYVTEEDKANKKPIPEQEVLSRNGLMLSDLEFVNINKYIGYEFKEAFLYTGNNIGRMVYEKILNIINGGE